MQRISFITNFFTAKNPLVTVWHNHLQFENFDNSFIQQTCPSWNINIDIILGGILVSRTETNLLSLTQKFRIFDCHKKLLFIGKSGDFSTTIKNNLKLRVSLEIRNEKEEILAYVDSKHFFSDEIKLFDAKNQSLIAKIYRNTFSLTWHFERYLPNHPISDPKVLGILVGKRMFQKEDSCNGFFNGIAYFFLIIAIILGLCILYAIVLLIKRITANKYKE